LVAGLLLLEHSAHLLSEHLAELNAPLVERVDAINEALSGDSVLVHCQQLAARFRRELAFEQQRQARPITRESLVLKKVLGHILSLELIDGLALG